MFENVSAKQLTRAAQLKQRIEELQNELEALLGIGAPTQTSRPASSAGGRRGPKGAMSAEGKARIIAAQKARWARFRKEKGLAKNGTSASGKPGRVMSAAARAKIAAAAKKRWATAKASGRNAL